MIVLLMLLFPSALAGLVAAWAVQRWPHADPAASATDKVGDELERRARIRRFVRSRVDPAVVTGLALTVALLGAAVAGTVVGVLVYMVRTNSGIVHADSGIARWAAANVNGWSFQVVRLITLLGSTPVIVVFAVVVAIFGVLRWRRASIVWFLTVAVGGQFLVMNIIKFAVDRARPDVHRLSVFHGSSFPSGHAMASAATYAALALVIGRGGTPRARAILTGAAVAIAVAVGCTRILLGVHWFSDVVAGLALGWAWFAVCAVAFGGRMLRFGAPAEAAAAPPTSGSESVHPRPRSQSPTGTHRR